MIELEEERYEWVPGRPNGQFRRVEDLDTLVDVAPLYADVSRQRVADGWHLIASTPLEENAKLYLVDVWTRVTDSVDSDI